MASSRTRYIPVSLRRLTIDRAGNCCEYCRLSQAGQVATFHIDHIKPLTAGGETTADNLALACVSCSLHKAARQTAYDPETRQEVSFYNPREQSWESHFRWNDVLIIGITAIGRATIAALDMNRDLILSIRAEEVVFRRHPPD